MNLITTRLELLYRSGDVKRLHTVATVNEHTIAAHVYGSLLIAVELCSLQLGMHVSIERVMVALLYHDAAEVATGDVPAPVKRASPELTEILDALESSFHGRNDVILPQLTDTEARIVKASDTLDLCFNCLRERRLGNRTAAMATVFSNAMSYINADLMGLPGVRSIYLHLKEEWDNA